MLFRALRRPVWIAWIAALPLASGADGAERLTAPLQGARVLTSSFGEYRSGHYHGGLDFSTGGIEGEPVRAPADGAVTRLRASGAGYGKSIYFLMEDGRTAVFAHLSRYHPRIAAAVEAEQDRAGRFEVDFVPPAGALRFAAGDPIAYTGSSGAGPAHLHAELREGSDASIAVNPLVGAWAVSDSVAPSVTRALIEPAAAGVRVNGGIEAASVSLVRGRPGEVTATGPVLVWLETEDRTCAGGNRLAPHRVRWTVDGRGIAEIAFDRVDWNAPGEVRWTFREDLARTRGERWVCLVPPPGARQRVARWLDAGPDWFAGLAPGPHRLRFEAWDAAGNRTERELTLRVSAAQDAVRDTARDAAHDSTATGAIRIRASSPDVPSAPVNHSDGLARLSFPSGAAYGALEVRVSWEDTLAARSAAAPELDPVTPVLRLGPWAGPLREDARVELLAGTGESRRGLALYRRDDGWTFVGADTSGEGVAGSIGALEDLALLRDLTAPTITLEVPKAAKRPRLVAHIADGGAGVTWRTLEMTLDGEPLIAEWDPEAARFVAHLRADPAPGEHAWVVRAADRVGNRAERSMAVTAR
jgi:hypothetical protein